MVRHILIMIIRLNDTEGQFDLVGTGNFDNE